MKVFSREKYIADLGIQMYNANSCWIDRCHGMPVTDDRCVGTDGTTYYIHDSWCEEIPEQSDSEAIIAAHAKAAVERIKKFFGLEKYKIIITSDGDNTTAKMIINGREVKSATAKRNPQDKPNWHIGAKTAFDRLFEGKKAKKRTGGLFEWIASLDLNCRCVAQKPAAKQYREVKRPAKAGEWIKLVDRSFTFNRVGDILPVHHVSGSLAYVLDSEHPRVTGGGGYWSYMDWEYVVLEGYKGGCENAEHNHDYGQAGARS